MNYENTILTMDMVISTILGSAVIAAIISAWVARIISERNIYIDNITKERAIWRESIRRIASDYPNAEDKEKIKLKIELASRLNPYDPEDLQLLECLRNVTADYTQELTIRTSLLLKHDWERAKNEAKSIVHRIMNPVTRITFKEYMKLYKAYQNGDTKAFKQGIEKLTKDKPWM